MIPHRDAASRADRRALVIGVGFALLLHAASLARGRRGKVRRIISQLERASEACSPSRDLASVAAATAACP